MALGNHSYTPWRSQPRAECRSPPKLPIPLAALTSNARPEVASIAVHQAVQVGEPGYLQVRANIVSNVIHCSKNTEPVGHRQGTGIPMEPRSPPRPKARVARKTTVRAPLGWTRPVPGTPARHRELQGGAGPRAHLPHPPASLLGYLLPTRP